MTRSDIRTRVRYHLNQSSAPASGPWQDEDLNRFINNGIEFIQPFCPIQSVSQFHKHQLDACDTADNWTSSEDGTTPAIDEETYKEGSGSIKIGASGVASTMVYYATPNSVDVSDYDYLNLWLYFADDDTLECLSDTETAVEIRIGSADNAYKYKRIHRSDLNDGWNLITIALDDLNSSGSPDMTAVDYIAIAFAKKSDSLEIESGKILMDDWHLSKYLTTVAGKYVYPAPKNCLKISRIEIWNGDYTELTGWQQQGKNIYFKKDYDGYKLKIFYTKYLNTFTSDTDKFELDDRYAELVSLFAAREAIRQLLTNKIIRNAYAGSVPEILAIQNKIENNFYDLFNNLAHSGMPMDLGV